MNILLQPDADPAAAPDFVIDPARSLGPIKAVNSICNAPTPSTAKYIRQVRPPYTRLHDSFLGPHPCIDLPHIFPDFDADETDPASYRFAISDHYIKSIKDCGMDIIYRLGNSMEGGPFRFHNHPPKDAAKWARICCHIISHYNEGWAGGHHHDIRYWEIWNEPDADLGNPNMQMAGQWSGTPEEFYEFYSTASDLIKRRFPGLRIGGYASCAVDEPSRRIFFEGFLRHLRRKAHALDFFSFHAYGDSPRKIVNRVNYLTRQLAAFGFGALELVCTEYNYIWEFDGIWPRLGDPDGEYFRQELFGAMRTATAASYVLAAMITFQNLPVSIATFYRNDNGGDWDAIWNSHGVPQKPFYALVAFNEVRGRQQLACETRCDGLHALAASGGPDAPGDLVVLISNYTGVSREYTLAIGPLAPGAEYVVEQYLTDHLRNHEKVAELRGGPGELKLSLYLRSASLTTLKVKRAGCAAA